MTTDPTAAPVETGAHVARPSYDEPVLREIARRVLAAPGVTTPLPA